MTNENLVNAGPDAAPRRRLDIGQIILSVLVVAVGIGLGGILAVIIGLVKEWIPFHC